MHHQHKVFHPGFRGSQARWLFRYACRPEQAVSLELYSRTTGEFMGATAAIAAFIANTSTRDFPPESEEKAKKAIADTFAAIVAGAGSEVAEPLHRYLGAAHASGAIPILGTGITAAPETAALVNGTFGAALDYDDVLSMMPAAIVAGAGSEVAEPLHRYLGAAHASGAIPILGTGITAAPETAAQW